MGAFEPSEQAVESHDFRNDEGTCDEQKNAGSQPRLENSGIKNDDCA
jgi:hypothetical protein